MKKISVEEFDRRFDNGEDISEFLDFSKATRPNRKATKDNVIVLSKQDTGAFETWGSLTEVCEAHNLPYHTLKSKKYPFEFRGFRFVKTKYRQKAIV